MPFEIATVNGDTRRFTLTITDENDEPVDLADGSLVFVAKRHVAAETILFEKNLADGITYAGTPVNVATLRIDDEDVLGLPNTWVALPCEVRFWRDQPTGGQTPMRGILRIFPGFGEPEES